MNNIYKLTESRKSSIILAILGLALLTSGLSSCADDYFDNYKFDYDDDPSIIAEEITMPLSLTVVPMVAVNPETRAGETYFDATPEEKTIADFWIIEYNEEGTRVGKPRYYKILKTFNADNPSFAEVDKKWETDHEKCEVSTKSINLLVPRKDQEDFTCVVIANTHDENLFNAKNRSKFSTLDSLRNFDFDIHNQQDFFYPVNNDIQQPEKYLLMSGWTKISKDPETWNPSVDLIRNACKVHVKLENFTDDLVFKYWQWRNVPFGKLFPHGEKVHYIQKVSRDWKQHTQDEQEDALEEIKKGYDFWVPCNVWLPEENYYQPNLASTGENPADEYEYVREEDPTYFAIGCRGANSNGPIGDKTLYEFKLYPSFDPDKYAETGEFDQFDFEPNHYYSIKVDIQKLPKGHPLFPEATFVELPPSNCYMLPIDTKDPYRVPLDQINYYWEMWEPDMCLDSITEWVAEVIWQDTPLRILDFAVVEDDALDARDKYEGAGNEIGFAFRTTGTGEGNVIIGVRKKVPEDEIPAPDKREYMWTWHIWITEYNPGIEIPGRELDVPLNWGYNKKSYDVHEGKVQRYYKNLSIEPFPTAYLMDRNLGALTVEPPYQELSDVNGKLPDVATPEEIVLRRKTFGLYYQYGRNAPFPTASPNAQPLYNIKGEVIEEFMHAQTKPAGTHDTTPVVNMILGEPDVSYPFAEAVSKPYLFFVSTYREVADQPAPWWDYSEWGDLEESYNNWFAGMGVEFEYGKSMLDPCPPGWQVPDMSNFARLEYQPGTTARKDPWMKLENSAAIAAGRMFGAYWVDCDLITNAFDESTGFISGEENTYIFDTSYVKDESLAIWLPGQGTRSGDQGGCEVFEEYPDYPNLKYDDAGNVEGGEPQDFGNGLWTRDGYAVKYTSSDIIVPSGTESESLCSGLGIRCQRIIDPYASTRRNEKTSAVKRK
ncbi:MAG: hypothetical protein K2N28_06985 [Muribaculaceae bacterium]|nr:hypothetical protein [Muribaculaceae bacterium]